MLREFKDQMGNTITVGFPPKRIISLVPSQTEFLADLGLSDEVVGITKFCIHPREWADRKTKIGGTKQFSFEAIETLKPDLVIGNKEENYREGIERLQELYPVWMSDINDLEDAVEMMRKVGELTDRLSEAMTMANRIVEAFNGLNNSVTYSVLYLIWRKPWMAAGAGTFIDDMLARNNFGNVVKTQRYPELSVEEIRILNPQFIFLSSEPYPFAEKHVDELSILVPDSRIILVDGEMFSWYGNRLLHAVDYFVNLQSQLRRF